MRWLDGLGAYFGVDVFDAGRRVFFVGHSVDFFVGQLFLGSLAGIDPQRVDGCVGGPWNFVVIVVRDVGIRDGV